MWRNPPEKVNPIDSRSRRKDRRISVHPVCLRDPRGLSIRPDPLVSDRRAHGHHPPRNGPADPRRDGHRRADPGLFSAEALGSNFQAVCPFHNEKTPSFNVNPQRQIFHCFGCHAGGDAIKFVMLYDNLSFPEAAKNWPTGPESP